jgi:hypothetical protein
MTEKLSCGIVRKVSLNSYVVITTKNINHSFPEGLAKPWTTARNRGININSGIPQKNSQYISKYRKNKNKHEIFSNCSYNVS